MQAKPLHPQKIFMQQRHKVASMLFWAVRRSTCEDKMSPNEYVDRSVWFWAHSAPMTLDEHYTPSELAKIAVRHLSVWRPQIVADMSAGEGSLLLEAGRRWPSARIVATDIDAGAVRRLAQMDRERWTVGRCNLFADKSRSACGVLRKIQGKVDALLLNPPFSCRGGSYRIVPTPEGAVRSSPAMAFLLVSLRYLSPRGEAVAILPAGAVHNMKDAAAWSHLRTRFAVRLLALWDKHAFPGCAASSVLVKLMPVSAAGNPSTTSPRTARLAVRRPGQYTTIVRGTCPFHDMPGDPQGPTLVHYTDLRNARVILNGHRGFGQHRCLSGPAVLIPRVGRVTPDKVTLLGARKRVMISDCVIGLKADSPAAASRLRKVLVDNFAVLASSYVGTGAPHITIDRLRTTLHRLGVGEKR